MNTGDQLLNFEKPTLNLKGGLQTTVQYYRDSVLLFEDVVNLSRNIERHKLTEKLRYTLARLTTHTCFITVKAGCSS